MPNIKAAVACPLDICLPVILLNVAQLFTGQEIYLPPYFLAFLLSASF